MFSMFNRTETQHKVANCQQEQVTQSSSANQLSAKLGTICYGVRRSAEHCQDG